MAAQFLLSNFGVHYYIGDYKDTTTVPGGSSGMTELTGIISADIGEFTKENTKYRTLDGDGWEDIVTLGQTASDGTFNCLRRGKGAYSNVGNNTYDYIRNWFLSATGDAGVESPKVIVEVVPRGGGGSNGSSEYDATAYYVIPNAWQPQTKDTESGQLYNFTVSVFGPQVPLKVASSGGDGFSFTKFNAASGASVQAASVEPDFKINTAKVEE